MSSLSPLPTLYPTFSFYLPAMDEHSELISAFATHKNVSKLKAYQRLLGEPFLAVFNLLIFRQPYFDLDDVSHSVEKKQPANESHIHQGGAQVVTLPYVRSCSVLDTSL